MKEIMFDDIDLSSDIRNVRATETAYDYFRVECEIDGESFVVLDTRNSRCSDMVFTDSTHEKNHAEWLMDKLGGGKLHYTYNHNPACWEEDIGEFDGYYGDGLDHIEELYYL